MSLDGLPEATHLRIHLLGRFQVVVGSHTVPDDAWRQGRAATLVKVLALAPHHRLHRDQLMDLLWPDFPPKRAANSLHQALHIGRRILHPNASGASHYLRLSSEIVSLAPDSEVWIDVDAFEEAAARAIAGEDVRDHQMALQLYEGDLLPDDLYQEWTLDRRVALKSSYLHVVEGLGRLAEVQGDLATAIRSFEQIVHRDAVREDAHVHLIRLYSLAGRRHDALRQYELLEQVLQDELDIEPEPAVKRLYGDILKGTFPPPRSQSPSSEPPTSLAAAPSGGNLPQEVNRFIGREQDVADLQQTLHTARVLTMTGTGGCGKTRLAVRLAHEVQDGFSGSAWFVELAGLRSPLLVPQAVASALRVPERPDKSPTETLADHLGRKEVLLVLDNCEHLIGAVAEMVAHLVSVCPRLRVLTTSREPLHIAGEVVWRVSSLSVPDPRHLPNVAELRKIDAVDLFLDRAQAVLPGFEITHANAPAVARICYRLDGIPLAIELAAARVGALSVEQILALLDDCFTVLTGGSRAALSRQQTLKALLDWSYDLLTEAERALFTRLAVFAGGFSFEAAEAVSEGPVLDALTGLIDKSLLQVDRQEERIRYRLLEPVRQYANLHLDKSGRAGDVYRTHAAWYADLAQRADSGLWGPDHRAWTEQLEREHDNLQAILSRCVRGELEIETGMQLVNRLWQFWLLGGYLTEGRAWLEALLAQNPPISAWKADTLMHAAALAVRQGDYSSKTAELSREGFIIYREMADEVGRSRALRALGAQAYVNGDYDRAGEYYHESGCGAGPAGQEGRALAVHELGVIAWARGSYGDARALLEESRERFEAMVPDRALVTPFLNVPLADAPYRDLTDALTIQEETWVMLRRLTPAVAAALTLTHIGTVARAAGACEEADGYVQRSVHAFRGQGDRAGLAQALVQMGNLYRSEGEYDAARNCLYESLALRRSLGDRRGVGRSLNNLGVLALYAGNMRRAHALFEESMALFESMSDRPGIAATCENRGHEALFRGDWTEAKRAYQRGVALASAMGGVKRERAFDLRHFGLAAIGQGEWDGAVEALRSSRALYLEMRDARSVRVLDRLLTSGGVRADLPAVSAE